MVVLFEAHLVGPMTNVKLGPLCAGAAADAEMAAAWAEARYDAAEYHPGDGIPPMHGTDDLEVERCAPEPYVDIERRAA